MAEELLDCGGAMRTKGVPLLRRLLRMPACLRTGERPAGAEEGKDFERLEDCNGVYDFVTEPCNLPERPDLRGVAALAGVFGTVLEADREAVELSMNFDGLTKSKSFLAIPSSPLARFGLANLENIETGSIFSVSSSS